jgi:hypothetical protein
MRGAALRIVHPCLGKTQLAVYGVVNVEGIVIFLSVVFPPANRAQCHCAWRVQRPVSAARASKANWRDPHAEMDEV